MEQSEVVAQVKELLNTAKTRGLTDNDIEVYLKEKGHPFTFRTDKKTDEVVQMEVDAYQRSWSLLNTLIFTIYPILFVSSLFIYPFFKMVTMSTCLVSELAPFSEVSSPIINCDMCRGVKEAPRISNLGREDFIRNYAYAGRPILVEGAVSNWSALQVFSYDYFKSIYRSRPSSLEEDDLNGQFFSYSSNIHGLKDFFSLPQDMVSMKTEKWYIGWSSSDASIGKTLRQHASIPDFIPPTLGEESIAWIFIGSPGPGANLHIDDVELPSWQAQLRGKKTWILVPPPECQHICHDFNVTMNTGDVIIVDTNKWYHKTFIHPGSISITIGSEYS